jgi:5-methylcytosine-specific restriction protein A
MPNGQWRGSTRRDRLPADWPQRCAAVRELYGTACYICSHGGASDTDHVQRGDDHQLSNLRPVCGARCQLCRAEGRTPCHVVKSSREGGIAAQAAKPKRSRPAERHPGMR